MASLLLSSSLIIQTDTQTDSRLTESTAVQNQLMAEFQILHIMLICFNNKKHYLAIHICSLYTDNYFINTYYKTDYIEPQLNKYKTPQRIITHNTIR